jgi:hypothetical protein
MTSCFVASYFFSQKGKGGSMSGMMGMMSGKGKGYYDDDYKEKDDDYGVSCNTFFS